MGLWDFGRGYQLIKAYLVLGNTLKEQKSTLDMAVVPPSPRSLSRSCPPTPLEKDAFNKG